MRWENPGGDLRAVEGTSAEVALETDRPLTTGAILLDDGTKLPLRQNAGGLTAMVPINKDGLYHIAAVEGGEDVRLSEDYFIEAQKYEPPEVKITRPGRDFKATPIEEVAITVEAKDGFAHEECRPGITRSTVRPRKYYRFSRPRALRRSPVTRCSLWRITRCSRATW
ncbi:MAG: hypothetical protein WDO73_15585 [Ignavibacteriota bacterium]